jgi:AraC family transcriptional regulator of adaptative response/methylated-DNA-[protein]-cysteine methyltransferase
MYEMKFSQQAEDYMLVEKAIAYVSANFKPHPTMEEVADNLQLRSERFEMLFNRWAGISPIQFFQFLTRGYARQKLAESRMQGLINSSSASGFSYTGSLHDSLVHFEVISPVEFKLLEASGKMKFGFHPTPFGECFLVQTERGILHLGFDEKHDREVALNQFKQSWPQVTLSESRIETGSLVNHIFSADHSYPSHPVNLLLKGTNFQISVWHTLLRIPIGSMVSYEDIANSICRPKAVRAVANAVAANPVAYLIPCHRVIAKSGRIHQYRWGAVRKIAMLGWEAARVKTRDKLTGNGSSE